MASRAEKSLWRPFVTPEGVNLPLQLGSAGSRAGAFVIDSIIILIILIAFTIGVALLAISAESAAFAIIWGGGYSARGNFASGCCEPGSRGGRPGRRGRKLRVVARDGARLTGAAVVARNAMREIEVFLPLSFLGEQTAAGTADLFLTLFALGWSGIFLFFPLFNRDRLRVGDLVAGTWVVVVERVKLSHDLVSGTRRGHRHFPDAALRDYGIYELQTLETVLRAEREDAIATVAATIRAKYDLPDDRDDYGFLADFYAALCARLEQRMALGQRRASKYDAQ